MELEPIGRVHTPIETTDDAPRQGLLEDIEGTIELEPQYAEGLDGYEPGDEVVVIWFANEADRSLLRVDKRDDRGVFTSRSPARPNPICLTTVEIVSIDGPNLEVRGVDMLDGSPVLDLKVPLS
ncbi:MAG: tRNA (N6-threonylcarbamoyladenosine(37)-N6)-methyltransferase TrmO [Halanaeroarchaeum sp.]